MALCVACVCLYVLLVLDSFEWLLLSCCVRVCFSCWALLLFEICCVCCLSFKYYVPPPCCCLRVVFVVFVSGLFFVSGLNVFLVFCCVCLCGSCLMVFV